MRPRLPSLQTKTGSHEEVSPGIDGTARTHKDVSHPRQLIAAVPPVPIEGVDGVSGFGSSNGSDGREVTPSFVLRKVTQTRSGVVAGRQQRVGDEAVKDSVAGGCSDGWLYIQDAIPLRVLSLQGVMCDVAGDKGSLPLRDRCDRHVPGSVALSFDHGDSRDHLGVPVDQF